MVEGALLGIAYLIVTWSLYTQWKGLPALYISLMLTAIVWVPSLIYASKMVHYAGYVILPALVIWIAADIFKYQKGGILR